jgi:hypothetical protein
MAYGNIQGIQLPYPSQAANVIPYDVFRLAINWLPNRVPLLARIPKLPLDALLFYCNNDNYRPRNPITKTNAAFTTPATTVTVLDSSLFEAGDLIQIDTERMIVTAVPTGGVTITVIQGAEGTTPANHASGVNILLITNASTGGDIDKNAISRLPSTVAQFSQTVQHAYQISGALQSTRNYMDGIITPLDRDRSLAMQHVMDDFESAMYYGKGGAYSGTNNNQSMKGFQTLLVTSNQATPTNAATYKPTDFIRDTLQACFSHGGQPDTILVSQDFLTGMSQWGWTIQRLDQPVSELGIAADVFVVPFLGGTRLVPAPLLQSGTAIAFNSVECRIRLKRPLFDQPRGIRGDALEGDMIMDGALDVENEYKHAMVTGVTGFAVQS